MARFFFDLDHGEGMLRDHEGTELPDLAAAQAEATETLTHMGRDSFSGTHRRRLKMTVRGENGVALMNVELHFSANPLPQGINGGRVR